MSAFFQGEINRFTQTVLDSFNHNNSSFISHALSKHRSQTIGLMN
jgi:hypothetical protein